MAREREVEIDENHLRELEDVARGVEGSKGDVSLAPHHAEVYEALGGDTEMMVDTGGGGVMVPCEHLCNLLFGEPEEPKNEDNARRRRLMGAKPTRKGGAADQFRESKRRRSARTESKAEKAESK